MKHYPGGVWVLVSVVIVVMSSCTPPTQPIVDDSFEESDEQTSDDKQQVDDSTISLKHPRFLRPCHIVRESRLLRHIA